MMPDDAPEDPRACVSLRISKRVSAIMIIIKIYPATNATTEPQLLELRQGPDQASRRILIRYRSVWCDQDIDSPIMRLVRNDFTFGEELFPQADTDCRSGQERLSL